MRAARVALAAVVLAQVAAYQLPPDKLEQAAALYRIGIVLTVVGLVLGIGVPIALLELGVSARLRDLAERASRRRAVQALVFVPLLLLAIALVSLPVDLYRQHVMHEYGLSVQGWGGWLGDWTKRQLVTWVIAV